MNGLIYRQNYSYYFLNVRFQDYKNLAYNRHYTLIFNILHSNQNKKSGFSFLHRASHCLSIS